MDDIVSWFRNQAQSGRGECVSGTMYFVVSDEDRRRLPELADKYGVAIQLISKRWQSFMFASEEEYDADVQASLCAVGFSSVSQPQ